MNLLKIFLVFLLLLCLAPMPYGYYQLVRFVAMMAFAIMAFVYYDKKKMPLSIIFGSLALLFQPFVKIVLGRVLWNVVDVVVAVLLIGLFYIEKVDKEKGCLP